MNKGHENLIPCKPGHTNNPNGRPKGSKNFKSTLLKYLNQDVTTEDLQGNAINITAYDMICLNLIKKASNDKDRKCIMDIMDRVEGKAIQNVKQEIINNEPLTIILDSDKNDSKTGTRKEQVQTDTKTDGSLEVPDQP